MTRKKRRKRKIVIWLDIDYGSVNIIGARAQVINRVLVSQTIAMQVYDDGSVNIIGESVRVSNRVLR